MPLVSALLCAASGFVLSSLGLVVLTMPANHICCVAPSIAGTSFPYSRRQGIAPDSQQCMLQGWHTLCVPIHWCMSFLFPSYPLSLAALTTIPYSHGTAGRPHWTSVFC